MTETEDLKRIENVIAALEFLKTVYEKSIEEFEKVQKDAEDWYKEKRLAQIEKDEKG